MRAYLIDLKAEALAAIDRSTPYTARQPENGPPAKKEDQSLKTRKGNRT